MFLNFIVNIMYVCSDLELALFTPHSVIKTQVCGSFSLQKIPFYGQDF